MQQRNNLTLNDTQKNINNLALNGTQKNIIEATLSFYLDEIAQLKPELAIKALNAMMSTSLSEDDIAVFTQYDLLSSIHFVHKILSHPCPQNRTTNYPYFSAPSDPNMVVYKNAAGKAEFEQKGLLSLTARNDQTALPVTKEAVVAYIHQLVNAAIIEQQKKQTPELQAEQPITNGNESVRLNPLQSNPLPVLHPAQSTQHHLTIAEMNQSLQQQTGARRQTSSAKICKLKEH